MIIVIGAFFGFIGFLMGIGTEGALNEQKQVNLEPINFTRSLVTFSQVQNPQTVSSLVSNTEQDQHKNTLLHLSNGLTINQTNETIKAGQSVSVTFTTFAPVCSYKIYSNGTVYNGTIDTLISSNKYIFNKIPNNICDNNLPVIKILSWGLNK